MYIDGFVGSQFFHVFVISFTVSFSNVRNTPLSAFSMNKHMSMSNIFLVLHQSFLTSHPDSIQEN